MGTKPNAKTFAEKYTVSLQVYYILLMFTTEK